MAAPPVQKPPLAAPIENLEKQFHRLEATWATETKFLSDPRKIMDHAAMRAIVAMGEQVVPLILRDLQEKETLLVWALPEITGENLTLPRIEGGFLKWDISALTEAWLQWGREKGFL